MCVCDTAENIGQSLSRRFFFLFTFTFFWIFILFLFVCFRFSFRCLSDLELDELVRDKDGHQRVVVRVECHR